MEKLTQEVVGLLMEIEEAARKGSAVLGEEMMQSIIDHAVALRQRTALSEGALTHMYIPRDLDFAKSQNISPEKIREFIKLEDYVALDQAAECIIQFRLLHMRWLQIIVGQKIYESEGLELVKTTCIM